MHIQMQWEGILEYYMLCYFINLEFDRQTSINLGIGNRAVYFRIFVVFLVASMSNFQPIHGEIMDIA